MKLTLKWLKEHLETDAGLAEVTATLTRIGHEVEGVTDRAAALAPFRVAYVKEARPHPNADRLRVCLVDTGKEVVQVVCGAPNAHTGMKGVFAPSGTTIPGTGLLLKPSEIRGEKSNGMLVSEREMGLSEEHEGIIELPEDAKVGEPFAKIAGLDDPVIEIKVTPNRGDCLGVHGIARDLAAAGLGRLTPIAAERSIGSFKSPTLWKRELPAEAADACPYVAGRSYRGLRNGPSPAWLQQRLRAIGLRPISALVDITNFVTFDLGRPLHVFDAGKLAGNPTMRLAKDGEEILALDGESYRLTSEDTVIADALGVQAIGGIMGGELSGATAETSEAFLEVALFDPLRVARSGRRLGIKSDARYRFERGLDPASAEWGVEVATRLILALCGGEASQTVSAGKLPKPRRTISFRPKRVETLGGLAVPLAEQKRILKGLGFALAGSGAMLKATVPGWRNDVEGEACLVEEVLRIVGYDEIPQAPLTLDTALPLPALTPKQRRVSAARTALAWRGLEEAVSFSFVSRKEATLFGGGELALTLLNPISADLDAMRPSVLAPLLAAVRRNADRGQREIALFEIGPEYRDPTPDGQATVAAGLRAGRASLRSWAEPERAPDMLDAKGDVLAVLEMLGAPIDNLRAVAEAPKWYHPGSSGAFKLGPNLLARFGEIHPRVLAAYDVKGPVAAFELYLDAVPEPRGKGGKLKPALELSPLQPVVRDFAFLVEESVAADTVLRAARGADKALIAKVELFDLYAGKGIPEGKKSLAIAVTLQPRDKTLTDAEIEAVAAKVVAQVAKASGGTLRA
ncbi:MAG: phenylalanine--tRNA ligase subunit beta [Kiloniellales bacterium]